MTKCVKSGNKAAYKYRNDNLVITRGRQNVTIVRVPHMDF